MTILALDTALQACSAALCDGAGRILAVRREMRARGHAERLAGMIETVLSEGGIDIAAISSIATTVGPGSFTGVRVALSAARGLALVTGAPVHGIGTLDVLAWAARRLAGEGNIAVAIDARRGEVYFQRFQADIAPLSPPALLSVADAAERVLPGDILCGSGAELLLNARRQRDEGDAAGCPHADVVNPDAADAAVLTALRLACGGKLMPPVPLYIRKPDAKLPATRP